MTVEDYLRWLNALIAGEPMPGEYVPNTNPLDVFKV